MKYLRDRKDSEKTHHEVEEVKKGRKKRRFKMKTAPTALAIRLCG
jgi:hypothetical protein